MTIEIVDLPIENGYVSLPEGNQFQDPKMEVPIPYIRPIFQAYVSEYHHVQHGLI